MTTNRCLWFLVLVAFSALAGLVCSKGVGEICTLRHNRLQGVCRVECQAAEDLAKRGVPPTVCGFQYHSIPIVCCEGQGTAQPNDNTFINVDTSFNSENSDSFVYPDTINPDVFLQEGGMSRSEQKCHEYSKAVTSTVSAVPLITHPEEISIDVVKCEYNGVPLIVGGSPASYGEFPFMAALFYYNSDNNLEFQCGGTLISEFFVMTAAHCSNTRDGPPVKVRLGVLDLRREEEGVMYDVVEVKVPDSYRPPAKYDDIALLRLAPKVQFSKTVRPACLWTKPYFEHTKSIATGYGRTGNAEDPSKRLLKVALNIVDNNVCSQTYPADRRALPVGIKSSMMCAGELKGGKDTCQGDSGGPLIVTKKGNQCVFYALGITSFGKGCGGVNLPAIYTKVASFIPWIERTVW